MFESLEKFTYLMIKVSVTIPSFQIHCHSIRVETRESFYLYLSLEFPNTLSFHSGRDPRELLPIFYHFCHSFNE